MIATLRLEAIGDNLVSTGGIARRDIRYVLKKLSRLPFEQRVAALSPARRPWVARLNGLDRSYGFARTFLHGNRDYREANALGSRGIWVTFVLHTGYVYEVQELLSWRDERRFFCRVDPAGKVVEMTRDEVLVRFDAASGAAQQVINIAARR